MCGDFTTNASTRGGKCLYCFDNPGQMVGGKPKALVKYLDAEQKKDAEASRLQLACAETPLSLELITLQTAYDAAKVGPPVMSACLPACVRTCLQPPPPPPTHFIPSHPRPAAFRSSTSTWPAPS